MPDDVKVGVWERNGVELDTPEELDLIPENIPFSALGFAADNVKDGIIEAAGGGGGSGDVVGPSSATDEAVARFDTTTGKLIQNSAMRINDSGRVGVNTSPQTDTTFFIQGSSGGNVYSYSVGVTTNYNAVYSSGSHLDFHSASQDFSITGITGGGEGKLMHISNRSTYDMTLKHQDSGSSSTKQFNLPEDEDLVVKPGGGIYLQYTNNYRWHALSEVRKAPIDWTQASVGTIHASNYVDNNTDTTDHTALSNIGTKTHATLDSEVTANNAKVTNATHTGEVTGSTALVIDKTSITNKTQVVAAATDVILVGDASDSNNLKKVTAQSIADLGGGGGSVFGTEHHEGSSAGQSSTTSTSYQQKLRLTTSSLPSGKYRIGWSFNWSYSSTGNDFEARVQINDSTTILDHRQEPQDSGTDQRHSNSGFYYASSLSGVVNIDLDYRTDSSSRTSYIRDARLEIWRIS